MTARSAGNHATKKSGSRSGHRHGAKFKKGGKRSGDKSRSIDEILKDAEEKRRAANRAARNYTLWGWGSTDYDETSGSPPSVSLTQADIRPERRGFTSSRSRRAARTAAAAKAKQTKPGHKKSEQTSKNGGKNGNRRTKR